MSRPALAADPFEAVTAPPQPVAATTRGRRRAAPAPAAGAGSAAHRVGTIAAPYTRQDGVQVRQWSATLPVDVVEALQVAAIQERRRPADIVADLIAAHCGMQLAAAPTPKPKTTKTAKTTKPKTRKR